MKKSSKMAIFRLFQAKTIGPMKTFVKAKKFLKYPKKFNFLFEKLLNQLLDGKNDKNRKYFLHFWFLYLGRK